MTSASVLHNDHLVTCAHCLEGVELHAYSIRCPEKMYLAKEAFREEHRGCIQYGEDFKGAQSHRRFVRAMRKAMKGKRSTVRNPHAFPAA